MASAQYRGLAQHQHCPRGGTLPFLSSCTSYFACAYDCVYVSGHRLQSIHRLSPRRAQVTPASLAAHGRFVRARNFLGAIAVLGSAAATGHLSLPLAAAAAGAVSILASLCCWTVTRPPNRVLRGHCLFTVPLPGMNTMCWKVGRHLYKEDYRAFVSPMSGGRHQ